MPRALASRHSRRRSPPATGVAFATRVDPSYARGYRTTNQDVLGDGPMCREAKFILGNLTSKTTVICVCPMVLQSFAISVRTKHFLRIFCRPMACPCCHMMFDVSGMSWEWFWNTLGIFENHFGTWEREGGSLGPAGRGHEKPKRRLLPTDC